ncbi:hypothetical protein ASE16_00850 [Leifsonia sp. Root227]|uniref:mechanosensitive ion channel family protein n=1 Tax=unclassified Leifsonia TaxID=2663824 RepID=UPI0006F63D82|nr:mechanosensitive ion channel domain-containing protein [Leifsonia sp. Root227]KRC51675.1 hypothetical protein ASE16_00850 [Leifsonia sp. Root227]
MTAAAPSGADAAGFLSGLDTWDIVFALLAVVAGVVLGIVAKRGATVLLRKLPGVTDDVRARIARSVRLVIILLGVGVAIAFLGAPIQPVIALAIIVAVIAVLALRGVSENFAAGVILQTRRPFVVGDRVTIQGYTGTVHELNGRSVTVRTLDGRTVHIPNSVVLSGPFVNESETGEQRSELQVRIANADGNESVDDETAQRIRSVCHDTDGVHHREAVQVLTTAVEPTRTVYAVRFWHHPSHGPQVRSAVIDALAAAFADRRVVITSALPDTPLTPPGEL